MSSAFDAFAERYDQWYDTVEGAAVFREETACLHQICRECRGRWLEVGVGTGRFASVLGIAEGIDPSPKMLEHAARRGVRVHLGKAETMDFPGNTFDGMLMALTLCFLEDAGRALRECARVLRPSGTFLLGIIPADGPWGVMYAGKAAAGYPIYSLARFRTVQETVALAESKGFILRGEACALLRKPGEAFGREPDVRCGRVEGAGFVGLRFRLAES